MFMRILKLTNQRKNNILLIIFQNFLNFKTSKFNQMKNLKKTNLKNIFIALIFGLAGGFIAFGVSNLIKPKDIVVENSQLEQINNPYAKYANYYGNQTKDGLIDFTKIAPQATEAVVHVKTQYHSEYDALYEFLFGDKLDEMPLVEGTGSGVIISPDGYIITNNHVIDNATELKVVLNDKRSYTAKIIGRDPATDLALLKIDEKDLPVLAFGNSDDLMIGEWVLAIGNPFNLTSTVTAGIVSAKARNISILDRRYAIESFIQTDAAVNPGNSGGALINPKGELIGINTAIASSTGAFAGYSFAVPATIVKKVIADLIEYGTVQRALLGVTVTEITQEFAEKNNLDNLEGVYVSELTPDGAAENAGIIQGDVVLKIDEAVISEVPEMLEKISQYSPGDIISVTVKRDNKLQVFKVTLRNQEGGTDRIVSDKVDMLGATFVEITPEEKEKLDIEHGVKITNLEEGKFKSAGVKTGFIVQFINDKPVYEVEDVEEIINNIRGGVYIEGVYPNGEVNYYAFGLK